MPLEAVILVGGVQKGESVDYSPKRLSKVKGQTLTPIRTNDQLNMASWRNIGVHLCRISTDASVDPSAVYSAVSPAAMSSKRLFWLGS